MLLMNFAAPYYHPQRSWSKVIFSEACVKNSVHREGQAWGGHAWQGGMRGRGACVAGGHVWQGGMCGRGACMAGGHMHGMGGVRGRGEHAWQILRDTVNERAVRILLEGILVLNFFERIFGHSHFLERC